MIKPILTRTIYDDGTQQFYRFKNGYGASVVQHSFLSKGDLWEIAPIKFYGDDIDDWNFTKIQAEGLPNLAKAMSRVNINRVLRTVKSL